MADSRKYFDLAVGESDGNGGDLQQVGNDLAVIYGHENQVYLALFGGNVEQNTPAVPTTAQRFYWWGNDLLLKNDSTKQFNSNTERALDNNALDSGGRSRIENAVKDDLKYIKGTITVSVTIPEVNTVRIEVKVVYPDGTRRLSIITFGKRTLTGDFSRLDFNEDFY